MDISFGEFFEAVHGTHPFLWQNRLAEQVASAGWPTAIGVPTGLGKTACIDIAVWALATQAARAPADRAQPRRIWYVVDRRLLIDAAHDRAEHLLTALTDPASPRAERSASAIAAITSVAEALKAMSPPGSGAPPLHVVRLRGGAELGRRSPNPAQPCLHLATVAMYASRLLFRGYGTSRLMRSVDAALAGTDALVLLDEAHIARPLMEAIGAARECDTSGATAVLSGPRAAAHLVALTATGDASPSRFDLTPEESAEAEVARRLSAPKPTSLVPTTRRDMARTLVREALRLARSSETTVVFCNTPTVARQVFDLIGEARPSAGFALDEPRLLTGRMRQREAEAARSEIVERTASSRDRTTLRAAHLIVVATQTLEVGADVDFDALITECAGARAMVQRFGRLNRLGLSPAAEAVVCGVPDEEDAPVYGIDATNVWRSLGGAVAPDMSPSGITAAVGQPDDIPKRSGMLLPAHLWELAKTSVQEPDEPDIGMFFDGFDDVTRTVSVAWRAHIPGAGEETPEADRTNRRLDPAVREREVVEVPIFELRERLRSLDTERIVRLADDRVTVELVPVGRLRPGDTVILPAGLGLYDENGWAPRSVAPVLDDSTVDPPTIWLDRVGLDAMLGRPVPAEILALMDAATRALSNPESEADEKRAAVLALMASLPHDLPHDLHPWLSDSERASFASLVSSSEVDLDATGEVAADGVFRIRASGGMAMAPGRAAVEMAVDGVFRIRGPRSARASNQRQKIRSDAGDELSFDIMVARAALKEHLDDVGRRARASAECIGLPEALCRAVELAGRYHDLGKSDGRFQRLLDPLGKSTEPMAKSIGRRPRTAERVDWPRGGRHEAVSGTLLQTLYQEVPAIDEDVDRELILHLVLSHHGHGRPLVPPVEGGLPLLVGCQVGERHVGTMIDLARTDWDQPRRFRMLCERYGYWGLALLEAIVRQGDHAASEEIETSVAHAQSVAVA